MCGGIFAIKYLGDYAILTRDKHREREHFESNILGQIESHNRRLQKLELNQIHPDRVISVKQSMVTNLIQKVVAMYSAGFPVEALSHDFDVIVKLIEESWVEGAKKIKGPRNIILDQYCIDSFMQFLRLLSIGFLLRLENNFFDRLSSILKTDGVIDSLFENILSFQLKSREIQYEKPTYQFKLFRNLKNAFNCQDKGEAQIFVQVFLEKDWLKELKMSHMLTATNKDWYYGRWSFASAVIVAIKDLDDSSFRDNLYYPKELVDFYKESI